MQEAQVRGPPLAKGLLLVGSRKTEVLAIGRYADVRTSISTMCNIDCPTWMKVQPECPNEHQANIFPEYMPALGAIISSMGWVSVTPMPILLGY